MQRDTYIRAISTLRITDAEEAGGKGANMGELVAANLPVPPGFVLLRDCYRESMNAGGVAEQLGDLHRDAMKNAADTARLKDMSSHLQDLVRKAGVTTVVRDLLIDAYASAGAFPEAYRVFLARDVAPVEGELHERTGEEADLTVRWVSLDDAYAAALAGRLHNPGALLGIMAAHGARASGWTTLRPHDTPWPEHPAYRDMDPRA